MVTFEAMTPQCGRSVDTGLDCHSGYRSAIYKAITRQCWRSVIQILVVRVDIRLVTYASMTPGVGGQWFMFLLSE